MVIRRRLLAAFCLISGVALLISVLSIVRADDKPGFVPTYRRWTRTASAYIADNKAFSDKKLNPANADLTGLLTIYANDTALANFLNGKQEPFAEGAVIVAESALVVNIPNTKVQVEKAAAPKMTLWMIKDSTVSKDQGGWRWELWTVNDGKDVNAGLDASTQVAACANCHRQLFSGLAAKTDLVFDDFSDTAHIEAYKSVAPATASADQARGTAAATTAR